MSKIGSFLQLCTGLLSLSSQFSLGATIPVNTGGLLSVPELRILPLGASIVYGFGSSDGNGFRKVVEDQLSGLGAKPKMVGTERHGKMTDNRVSGYPGDLIKEIATKNKDRGGLKFKPNVILFNGGTNNCAAGNKPKNMVKDIDTVVTDLFKNVPGVTIFMSSLIVNANPTHEACGVAFNKLLQTWTEKQEKDGYRIHFVDMHGADGPQRSDLISDGTHPNDAGHKKMAHQWVKRMLEVDSVFPDEIIIEEGQDACNQTTTVVISEPLSA